MPAVHVVSSDHGLCIQHSLWVLMFQYCYELGNIDVDMHTP